MNTSWSEFPRWSAKQLPKLPAPKTRIFDLGGGVEGNDNMVNFTGEREVVE